MDFLGRLKLETRQRKCLEEAAADIQGKLPAFMPGEGRNSALFSKIILCSIGCYNYFCDICTLLKN